ncbi:MAG: hypothetical protein AAF384_06090 [Pseudomonadota bacterium]
MKYVDINEAIKADGLRIVIVKAMPSAWGVAAKAMVEFKDLDCLAAHQIPMGDNPELLAWSGTNSAPVLAWNDEPPINRWNDILLLLERLAPDKPLIPSNMAARIAMFGLCHEICGELGFGWNRRLSFITPPKDGEISDFGKKYGYRIDDATRANDRAITFMNALSAILKSQKEQGSAYLIGDSVTAADFYWAAFSNFVAIQSQEDCPINPKARPMFEQTSPDVVAAIDPILLEHRDYIMRTYYTLPLEL